MGKMPAKGEKFSWLDGDIELVEETVSTKEAMAGFPRPDIPEFLRTYYGETISTNSMSREWAQGYWWASNSTGATIMDNPYPKKSRWRADWGNGFMFYISGGKREQWSGSDDAST